MFTICSVMPDSFIYVLSISFQGECVSALPLPESTFTPALPFMFDVLRYIHFCLDSFIMQSPHFSCFLFGKRVQTQMSGRWCKCEKQSSLRGLNDGIVSKWEVPALSKSLITKHNCSKIKLYWPKKKHIYWQASAHKLSHYNLWIFSIVISLIK